MSTANFELCSIVKFFVSKNKLPMKAINLMDQQGNMIITVRHVRASDVKKGRKTILYDPRGDRLVVST